jgi:hypothetical protein
MLAAIRSGASAASRSLEVVAQLELVLVGAVLLALAGLLLTRELRRWRGRSRPHSDEVRARAMMGELCPNGWQAQLTLYASGHGGQPGAPQGSESLVAVDWSELASDGDDAPPQRRVWGATISEGLAAMVEDRRTDEVLERIERSAAIDDDLWDAL